MVGVMAAGLSAPARQRADDAARDIREMLEEVVASQMISDVLLGSFLSGGVTPCNVFEDPSGICAKRMRRG